MREVQKKWKKLRHLKSKIKDWKWNKKEKLQHGREVWITFDRIIVESATSRPHSLLPLLHEQHLEITAHLIHSNITQSRLKHASEFQEIDNLYLFKWNSSNRLVPLVCLYRICIIPLWKHIRHQRFYYISNAFTTRSLLYSSGRKPNWFCKCFRMFRYLMLPQILLCITTRSPDWKEDFPIQTSRKWPPVLKQKTTCSMPWSRVRYRMIVQLQQSSVLHSEAPSQKPPRIVRPASFVPPDRQLELGKL